MRLAIQSEKNELQEQKYLVTPHWINQEQN
jgi:hypothetical protein